jgi:glycerophosphoryl diester phosphodiesterase
MPYMAIVKDPKEIEIARSRDLRYVGTEVLFSDDASPLADPAFIKAQHDAGLLVWCNAIVYNYRAVLAGGHSDDRAVLGNPDGSWGWIADRGFDLMQTDRVLEAALYLDKTGRRPKGSLLC